MDKNYLTYPTQYMNISQSYDGLDSHFSHLPNDYPIDEACEGDGRSYFYCPCDQMQLVEIYGYANLGTNTIWLESLNKVIFANGEQDYVTIMIIHPNDDTLAYLSKGQIFQRGAKICLEGNDGNATGYHFHISVGKGAWGLQTQENRWTENNNGKWCINTPNGPIKPEDAFFIDPSFTTILKTQGLNFKTLSAVEPQIYERIPINENNFYSNPLLGIDISEHNNFLNITSIKNQGYKFAILRIGGRYWGRRTIYNDDYFETFFQEAKSLNFPIGVYFFSTAITTQEAQEEAEYILNILQGRQLQYPIYIDMERNGAWFEETSPNVFGGEMKSNISWGLLADIADTFMNAIAQARYLPGIYSGVEFFGQSSFKNYYKKWEKWSKWLANYYSLDTVKSHLQQWNISNGEFYDDNFKIDIWQYAGDSFSNELGGKIDKNYQYYDIQKYIQNNGWNGYANASDPEENNQDNLGVDLAASINNYFTYPFKFFNGDKIQLNALTKSIYSIEYNQLIPITFDEIKFNNNNEGIFYCPCNQLYCKNILELENNKYMFTFSTYNNKNEQIPVTTINEELNIDLYIILQDSDYIYFLSEDIKGKRIQIKDINNFKEQILSIYYFRDLPIFELNRLQDEEKNYFISVTRLSKTKMALNKTCYLDLDFTIINNQNNYSLNKLPIPGIYNIPLYYYYHNIETPETMLLDQFSVWNFLIDSFELTLKIKPDIDFEILYNNIIQKNPDLINKLYIYSNRQKIVFPENQNYFIIYKNQYGLSNRLNVQNSLKNCYSYCIEQNNTTDIFLIYNNENKLIDAIKIAEESNNIIHLLYGIYPMNSKAFNLNPLAVSFNFLDLYQYWKNNFSYLYYIYQITSNGAEEINLKQIFPSPYKYRVVLQEKVMPESIFDLEYPIIPNGQENEKELFERAKLICNSYGNNWCVIDNKNNILYTPYDFFNIDDIVGIQTPLLEQDELIIQLDYMKDNLKLLKKCWNTDNVVNILNHLNNVFINNPNGKMIITEINNSNEFDYQTATIRYDNISNTNLPTIFPLNVLYTITSSYTPVDINDTWRIKPYLVYLFKNEQEINENKISPSLISNNLIPVTYFNRIVKILDENNRPITKTITNEGNEIEICKVRVCMPKNFECHLDSNEQEWIKTNLIGWIYSSYLF